MSESELWGCRNVAEYAYCPRLFYYMAVEGIFLPSPDTEQGCAVHRWVDRPSCAPSDRKEETESDEDPDRPKSIRSLALSSTRLGISAVLDLAEIFGNTATPVEYRKGAPKHLSIAPPPEETEEADSPPLTVVAPWPADRIQVGLQALLLEEAGYTVNEAVLYYAEEKRKLTIPVDQQLRNEALTILEAAKKCAEGPRPLPLVNDPRCPGVHFSPSACRTKSTSSAAKPKLNKPHPASCGRPVTRVFS